MALTWKPGEGYDIHVLRGGPASKSLAGALNLPPNADASTLKFEPEFDGAPFNLRVRVRESTGEVTAMVPPPNTSQIEIHNFLIRASVRDL